jgi:hypothetical protein
VSETDALSAARGGGKKKELMEAVRENPLTDLERMIEQDALGGEICWGMGWVFSSASPALVYCCVGGVRLPGSTSVLLHLPCPRD